MADEGGADPMNQSVVANRLLIVGDSLAMGAAEVNGKEVTRYISPAYPDLLRKLLPELEIILVCGVRYDTHTVRKHLPELLETHRPAVVLVAVGGSDADPEWRRVILSNGKHSKSRVSHSDYESNLRTIVAAANAACVKPILVEGTNQCAEMRGVYLSGISGRDVSAMIMAAGGQEATDRRVEPYREIVRRIAAESHIKLAISPERLVTDDPHIIFTEDGVHLSVVAQHLLADTYAPIIRSTFDLPLDPQSDLKPND